MGSLAPLALGFEPRSRLFEWLPDSTPIPVARWPHFVRHDGRGGSPASDEGLPSFGQSALRAADDHGSEGDSATRVERTQ